MTSKWTAGLFVILAMTMGMVAILMITSVAAFGAAGSTGATFLKIGIGARFEAMGGASTAIADDAESMNSNIAGLMALKRPSLTLMHNEYMMDITQEYMAFGMPLNSRSAVGISLIMVDAGALTGFTAGNIPTGSFSAKDMAFSAGYAVSVSDSLKVGAAVKYVKSEIAADSASTLAFDAGLIWSSPKRPLTLGVSITNLGSGLKFISEADQLPSALNLGAAYRFDKVPLLLSGQVSLPNSDDAVFNLGVEYSLMDVLKLRAGFNSSNDLDNGFTFGLGFSQKNYRVDYGYVPMGVFGDSHRFSWSMSF